MCTLAVAFQQHPGFSLVVAANRDEALGRPARGPFRWPEGFLAPRDEQAGGTWLGLNQHGLFVAITNRFLGPREQGRRSRGELVTQALLAKSAHEAHERVGAIDPRVYNGFHLLYADASAGFITWSDGEKLHPVAMQPGLHVVTERSFGAEESRAELVRAAWPKEPHADRLMALLRLKGVQSPLDGTYVYAPDFNYGTRSSMVLKLAQASSERSQLWWAEGPPPEPPPFRELSELLSVSAEKAL